MKILDNGNIEITVQLMPGAYAALMATTDRDKLTKADAVNAALLTFDHLSKVASEAGEPRSEAVDQASSATAPNPVEVPGA